MFLKSSDEMDRLIWYFVIFVEVSVCAAQNDSHEQQSFIQDTTFQNENHLSPDPSQNVAESDNRDPITLETVILPQNRIPLRLLQRNRFRHRTTTTPTEPIEITDSAFSTDTIPVLYQKPAVENMIMDKTQKIGRGSATLVQSRPGSVQFHERHGWQVKSEIVKNREPTSITPEIDSNMNFENGTDESNETTPFPLPIPLDKVPFDLRPQQEIQNRLLEDEWIRSGKNISYFLNKHLKSSGSAASRSRVASTSSSTSTSTATTTEEPPRTSELQTETEETTTAAIPTAPARSIFANFMANKHGNARDYLKAIFENRIENDQSQQPTSFVQSEFVTPFRGDTNIRDRI